MWKKDVSEYCKNCDRCQKANKSHGKSHGNMIKMKEPSRTWEIVDMDWVTGLSQVGDKCYTEFLVIVERFSNTPIFLPCHKDNKSMDPAIIICNRVVLWTGIFTNCLRDRNPKFTSAPLKILHQLFGTNFSFYKDYPPQAHGLAERVIQNLEYMVRRFCAYGLEF
ncbi:hypothetical protein O181_058631 [Austropuccinia psidii MF-1]|uniref:Integrase catalytic domain-containing protein n=1 Tax=Austropuccinia psidii MF-1 TaxID=1389203 RepID=A0A9Q3EHF7_9BASI|nr:hypothetical protein [Austropuccinia psidii MF-1]